jgi:2-keto-3-deoxy-6-phosphogluconate aldolase
MSVTESARLLAIIRFHLKAVRRAADVGRVVGVGTVTTVEQVAGCADAGARFATATDLDRIAARAVDAVADASNAGSP